MTLFSFHTFKFELTCENIEFSCEKANLTCDIFREGRTTTAASDVGRVNTPLTTH